MTVASTYRILSHFLVLVSLVCCSTKSHNKQFDFNSATDSVEIKNGILSMENDSLLEALKENLKDPKTYGLAVYWLPRAMQIQFESNEICKYLDQCITNSISGSSLTNADSLRAKLILYKKNILRIDPEISRSVVTIVTSFVQHYDSILYFNSGTIEANFLIRRRLERIYTLEQTKNNIETIEHSALLFCACRLWLHR